MAKMANSNNFKELVSGELVLVDFFAPWCGPCKMLAPVLEEIESERGGFDIVKVDIDQNTSLAQEYGIMSVPTLMLFKNGEPVAIQSGYLPKELLLNWIESNK